MARCGPMANLSRRTGLLRARINPFLGLILLTGAAVAQDPQTPEDTGSTFKVKVNLVSIYATVTAPNGAPITDLKKEDFGIAEDGHPERIAVFEQESERPVSIILAMDASQSVRKDL